MTQADSLDQFQASLTKSLKDLAQSEKAKESRQKAKRDREIAQALIR